MDTKPRQRVRYLRTEDGVQLAWAEIGTGPVLIKAANWLSHLEYELESPVWGHWFRFFGDHFRFLRWDERGCGLTDRNVDDLSFDRWIRDIEAVVAASGVEEPFAMLGISSGAATSASPTRRAIRSGSRQLILYGGYARGWAQRSDSDGVRAVSRHAGVDAGRLGQGESRFPPGLHVALHPRRQRGANRLVQRAVSTDEHWRDGGPDRSRLARQSTFPTCSARSRCRRSSSTPAMTRSVPSRKRPPGRRNPGSAVRRAGQPQPHSSRGRAGVGALSGSRPRFHGSRGPGRGRRGPRLRPPHGPRARGAGVDHAAGSATPTSARASRSARRPSATTSRICSTSSGFGPGRRRSCSRETAVSGPSPAPRRQLDSALATASSFAGPRLVSSLTILTKLGCSSPETRNVQR